MALSVTIDPADRSRLVFSQPVTLTQAIAFLWPTPPKSQNVLRPDPAELAVKGAQRRFIIDTSNKDALMGLRQEVMNQYITVVPIRAAEPSPLPAWLPLDAREQILGFSLPNGAHRFPGTEPWGAIVVWIRRASNNTYLHAEGYREFPEKIEYYLDITEGNQWQAQLLLDVYTEFNANMRYFVEQKGLSPREAEAEIRRINNEVFPLVLGAAVSILSAGAGIMAANKVMRDMAPNVIEAAIRTRRGAATAIRPVNGSVNVGGGDETPGMTNLNLIKPGSGGPEVGIPNHIKAPMGAMDRIFEPGSVKYMMSSKVFYKDFNWPHDAKAAHYVMTPGGKVEMNVWCTREQAGALKAAFEGVGFKNVTITGSGAGTMLEAVR